MFTHRLMRSWSRWTAAIWLASKQCVSMATRVISAQPVLLIKSTTALSSRLLLKISSCL